jgi:putative PIN family toxin of toxin-antitoxin system
MSNRIAVADTNLVISFFMGSKAPASVAFSLLMDEYQLIASHDTFAEFREVFMREKFARIRRERRLAAVSRYRFLVEMIPAVVDIHVCADPKDDKFLSLAVSGNASLILTSDDHLLRLNPFRGIAILKPAQYLERTMHVPERPPQ